AESEIVRPAILTFDPWKARTTSSNWPTRFSKKMENWVTEGQLRPCNVSNSTSLPPLSPKLIVEALLFLGQRRSGCAIPLRKFNVRNHSGQWRDSSRRCRVTVFGSWGSCGPEPSKTPAAGAKKSLENSREDWRGKRPVVNVPYSTREGAPSVRL